MLRFVSMSKRLGRLLYLLIPVILATWLYAPALFCGKTQIHGDSIFHSTSVLEFNRKMLHEGISPLWTNLLFGGHPYFAESQGGFLNPLNLAVALFFDPVTGQNIYHWLSIIIGALGMFLLCRLFQYSRDACLTGALAVVFSGYWLHSHNNITISGALCIIPWVFLCFEIWLKNPDIKSALWLALGASLLVFAGYPQALHGAIIYMAVSLTPSLLSGLRGDKAGNTLKQYFITGSIAVAAGVGIAAVQWLPLIELTTWSQRSSGVASLFQGSLSFYIPEFLFSFKRVDINTLHLGIVNSVFVCFVASLALILKPNLRIIGHILASLFLIVLGLENVTPLFGQMLKYSLIPGLQFFRIFHVYLGIAVIGLGLLAAFAVDRIANSEKCFVQTKKDKLFFLLCGSMLFLTWTGLIFIYKSDQVLKMTYAAFIAAYIILITLTLLNKSSWFGRAAAVLIVMEIIFLRISPFPFFDSKAIEDKSWISQYIQGNVLSGHYKILNASRAGLAVFTNPWNPNLESEIHKAIKSGCANANVLWNIPSLDANLALQLARRKLIQPQIEDELSGRNATLPGNRLIDYLGIRFISTDTRLHAPGFEALTTNGIVIMENKRALPHAQIFTRYEMVSSAKDALNRLQKARQATLFLEFPFDKFSAQSAGVNNWPPSSSSQDPHAATILSAKISSSQYEFAINARQPAWLFIADTNYPGWQASIDNQPTPVYSAQILGKAVFIPAGRHQVIIEYKPRSFITGMLISLLTLLFLLFSGMRILANHRKRIPSQNLSLFII